MPKNLTDVSQWETVAVPVGTDPATAASIETTFQILADRLRYLHNHLCTAYLNLNEADTSSLATIDMANVKAGCIRVSKTGPRVHTIIDNDGETAICMHSGEASPSWGGGGVYWEDEADTPNASLTWTVAATIVDICGAWSGASEERCAVSNSATGQVAYSPAFGNWAAVAGGVAGIIWTSCEHGYPGSELWVIGGNAGAIATTPNISSTAFSSQTSGLTGAVIRIRSNRKPNGYHQFLALDDAGNVSVSDDDGDNWTPTLVASLGLTSTLESIAWDADADRWVGIQYDGKRAWSVDGKDWTESTGSHGLISFVAHADNEFFLDADDQGNLILGIHRWGNISSIYVSGNSGDDMPSGIPWEEAYWPGLYTYAKILFMGQGKLIAAGSSGIVYSDETFTTRWSAAP